MREASKETSRKKSYLQRATVFFSELFGLRDAEREKELERAQRQAMVKQAQEKMIKNRTIVRTFVKEMPAALARAERDEAYLERISGPKTKRFWRVLLKDPHYYLSADIDRIAEPHTSAFSLMADQVYYISRFEESFFSVLQSMIRGVTMAQIALAQYEGRQSFFLKTNWVKNNALAVADNLTTSLKYLREIKPDASQSPAAYRLHEILDTYFNEADDPNQLTPKNMALLQSAVLPALVCVREEEINRITVELDNAIRVTDGFRCMSIRSLLDVLIIESARDLLATDPIKLPIDKIITKRALKVAEVHGAPGLMICARVYYELSLYYLAKCQYYKKSNLFFQSEIAEYQKKARVYAEKANMAAKGAVDSYRTKKNQQRIKNLGFFVKVWSLFYDVDSFEKFQMTVEKDLLPCLPIVDVDLNQTSRLVR